MIVEIDPHSPLPPYEQLRQQIADMITRGTLDPGTRLPPIRQLASDLGLAAGTVARAYRELEANRLVVTAGRRGTRVSDPASWSADVPPAEAERRLREAAQRYATLARQLGVSSTHALDLVNDTLEAAPESASSTPGAQ